MFNSQFPILIRMEGEIPSSRMRIENWDMSGANASPTGRSHQELNIDQIPVPASTYEIFVALNPPLDLS